MVVMEVGSVSEVKEEQPLKAPSPMLVMEGGNLSEIKEEQSIKT